MSKRALQPTEWWNLPPTKAEPGRRSHPLALGRDARSRTRAVGKRLDVWFGKHGRDFPWRQWRDPYRLLVAELMLQRTRAETVRGFIGDFLLRYPDWERLAQTSPASLASYLTPIGLAKRRSACFHNLAVSVISDPEGPMESRPGIGQYISRAVRVTLTGAPEAMVDSNFVRVIHRVFRARWKADYRYDPRLQALSLAIVQAGDPRRINWAMLDLGATVCQPRRPKCPICPLVDICAASKQALHVKGVAGETLRTARRKSSGHHGPVGSLKAVGRS